jgi:integrase
LIRGAKVLYVRRVLVGGNLRPYGKTAHALSVVPLAEKALEALEGHPARIDTPLLFSTRRGTPIDLHRWRARHWRPPLRAAGVVHRGPYALRHTFASWAIAACLPTFEIAATGHEPRTAVEDLRAPSAGFSRPSEGGARLVPRY